jgi:hypothetical protein
MELASVQSGSAVDDLPKPSWFSTPRPTIVTALPSHTPSNGSADHNHHHPVSSPQSHSPWPQSPYLTSPDITTPYSVRRTVQYSLIPHSRFVQSTFPTLPHGHSWSDVFSSPLNPDLFAHLAATGVLVPVASTSNGSIPSPTRSQPPLHLLDVYDSQQGHCDPPFISPLHPSFQDKRNLATSPYDESKSRHPIMADASATIPRSAGTKSTALRDSKRDIHDDITAHSRRDSAGKVFCRCSVLDLPNCQACQGPPSHRATYQILMQRLPITIPTPISQLADQMPVFLHHCGCLRLHRPRPSPSIRMPHSML